MENINVLDKKFKVSVTRDEIEREVKRVASEINRDYKGKTPLLLGVLNGSFMFVADLMRAIELDCEIRFVRLTSYQGTDTTGEVKVMLGLNESLKGRDVIVIEDIVDTGFTMQKMLAMLKEKEPASVEIASFLLKPARLKVPVNVKYSAFTIPDKFVVGYGLDYNEYGRNLPELYEITE